MGTTSWCGGSRPTASGKSPWMSRSPIRRRRRRLPAESEDMTTADQGRLRDFAERYTAAWCSQNPASVAAFFSPDGSLQVNDGVPAIGRAAITDVARGFMRDLPDMQVLMDDVSGDNSQAVYRWTLIGTNTGPGGTGRKVHVSGFEEWRFDGEGLVTRSLGHFDSAEYQRQIEGR